MPRAVHVRVEDCFALAGAVMWSLLLPCMSSDPTGADSLRTSYVGTFWSWL